MINCYSLFPKCSLKFSILINLNGCIYKNYLTKQNKQKDPYNLCTKQIIVVGSFNSPSQKSELSPNPPLLAVFFSIIIYYVVHKD